MKITPEHRKRLKFYLDQFYNRFPNEKYTVFHFVRYFKQRLKNNKDAWMAVCGETSVGKSLAVLMSMILFGRPMTLTDNVAYIPKGNEILDMFDKLNFQTLLIDEAAREMRSVNWQSKQQQGVNVKAMTDRFKNNWVFLNMPNFSEFTKSMRMGNLQFRCIIPYRNDLYARVVVQRKSRNWRDPDQWGDEFAMKVYQRMEKKQKELTNEHILRMERSFPQTVMDFIVPNLEIILPEITNEYERLKDESRKRDREEEPKSAKINKYRDELRQFKIKMAHLIHFNPNGIGKAKITATDISQMLGISPSTFKQYLKLPIQEKQSTFREELKKEKFK